MDYRIEKEFHKNGTKKPYDIFKNKHEKGFVNSEPHIHTYYEITYCRKGQLKLMLNESEELTLEPGDIYFIAPNVIHKTWVPTEGDFLHMESITVKFTAHFLHPMETTLSDSRFLLIPHQLKDGYLFLRNGDPRCETISEILVEALRENTEKNCGYELALRSQMTRLYIFLIRNDGGTSKGAVAPEPNMQDAKLLYNAITYIESNYDQSISMNDVAAACGMGYYQFSRFFLKCTKKNFNEYLLDYRINRARKKLLSNTEQSVTEIALDCGFENVSYFIRKFKAATGQTPKQFRNYYRQK